MSLFTGGGDGGLLIFSSPQRHQLVYWGQSLDLQLQAETVEEAALWVPCLAVPAAHLGAVHLKRGVLLHDFS
jgi:hypothetical protein